MSPRGSLFRRIGLTPALVAINAGLVLFAVACLVGVATVVLRDLGDQQALARLEHAGAARRFDPGSPARPRDSEAQIFLSARTIPTATVPRSSQLDQAMLRSLGESYDLAVAVLPATASSSGGDSGSAAAEESSLRAQALASGHATGGLPALETYRDVRVLRDGRRHGDRVGRDQSSTAAVAALGRPPVAAPAPLRRAGDAARGRPVGGARSTAGAAHRRHGGGGGAHRRR